MKRKMYLYQNFLLEEPPTWQGQGSKAVNRSPCLLKLGIHLGKVSQSKSLESNPYYNTGYIPMDGNPMNAGIVHNFMTPFNKSTTNPEGLYL